MALSVAVGLLAAAPALAAPPGDDFAQPVPLQGESIDVTGTTLGASTEAGEPSHGGDPIGPSVWYSWRAPRSRLTGLELCGGGVSVVATYEGDALADLVPLGSARSDEHCGFMHFRAVAGRVYLFAVDTPPAGGISEGGAFSLQLESSFPPPPENDDFASAASFSSMGFAGGSTEGANREPGEPAPSGDPAGASVWYRWTASASGPMVIYACSGGFRLALGVYTGSDLAGLASVARPGSSGLPNPNLGSCSLAGQDSVTFDATAGTRYSVAVDGVDGGFGEFRVELAAPVIGLFPPPQPQPVVRTAAPTTYILGLRRLGRQGRAVSFTGSASAVAFSCSLDRAAFVPCRSPRSYLHLSPGRHRIAVMARDAAGIEDRTAAVRAFRIGGTKR